MQHAYSLPNPKRAAAYTVPVLVAKSARFRHCFVMNNDSLNSHGADKNVVSPASFPRSFSELTARDVAWIIMGCALAYVITLI